MLKFRYKIIQAPMAGGPTTPELVAKVSNTGGALGSIGGGYMKPDTLQKHIWETRKLTTQPFAVNLFVPEKTVFDQKKTDRANQLLDTYYRRFKLQPPPYVEPDPEEFNKQLRVVIEEGVKFFSFTFGVLSPAQFQVLKDKGVFIMGTATTVEEAVILAEAGCDAIVAQGSEAGGHRGTFNGPFFSSMIKISSLVPQVIDRLGESIPIIAAGGIMNGRDVAKVLSLGATAVQMGTAFLVTKESGAHPAHKRAVLDAKPEDTVITRTFSGKPARGILNTFIKEMSEHEDELPEYPVMNSLTIGIRKAAAAQNDTSCMSLWAGEGVGRCKVGVSARDLVKNILKEADEESAPLMKF